jgi:hypothetical protein
LPKLIDILKSFYAPTHPLHAQRAATLEPLTLRARAAVAAHHAYAALDDYVRQVAALNLAALQRRLRPDIFKVVVQLVAAASLVRDRGRTTDVVAALEAAEDAVDTAKTDREFAFAIENLTKQLDRVEGCIAGVRAAEQHQQWYGRICTSAVTTRVERDGGLEALAAVIPGLIGEPPVAGAAGQQRSVSAV